MMKNLYNIFNTKMLLAMIIAVSLVSTSFGQTFVLDLEYNPLTFTNAQKTIINNAGNNGKSAGSVHKYSNVVTKDGVTVYAHLTILETNNAFITNFDDDTQTGSASRFQPRIGSNSGGGYILYKLEFFDTADDEPVFLYDYYATGVDIDGSSSSNREYVEFGGYESYQKDATCALTITTNASAGRTQFKGISYSLSGVTFDNTASFIVNYSTPNNEITFALGQTSNNNERYYSVQFGAAGGVYTNPVVVNNPLPVAVDDIGIPIDGTLGGVSVANILDNDTYDGSAIIPANVTITEIPDIPHAGVSLNETTGEVSVAAGTSIGTYYITYQICMNAASNDCDIALITVEVTGSTSIINNFPATGYGTLAFEDMWPTKADYDFNDLVVDYKFEISSDQNNEVSEVEATFIIKAFGATYDNGFGFQFDASINPSHLSVTGSSITESYISLASNGLEANQSKPTFIVFDNAFNQMSHPGTGIGVNTEPSANYVTPDTIRLTISFDNGAYTLNDLNISNFNPFLIVDLNRGVEVHLPNYEPTDLADVNLLGTADDDSNAGLGKYYKTANNLPWAINIYESFKYPNEKAEIGTAHLKFVDWAGSNGNLYPDWYLNLPNYRNNNNIYNQP